MISLWVSRMNDVKLLVTELLFLLLLAEHCFALHLLCCPTLGLCPIQGCNAPVP